MYEIKTENVYEYFNKDKRLFEFISYSVYSKYYDKTNYLVVGKMKDEICCMPIKRFARFFL